MLKYAKKYASGGINKHFWSYILTAYMLYISYALLFILLLLFLYYLGLALRAWIGFW